MAMTLSRGLLIAFTLSLAACAGHEGVYQPACTAYEGDTLELDSGRFEWRRFTDERVVNQDGEVVAPFPGFPKSGTYTVSKGRLELVTDDNDRLQDWFIVESDAQRYLLDARQHDAFLATGALADCPLRLTPADAR